MSMMPGRWKCKRCKRTFDGGGDWDCGDRAYSSKYACPLEPYNDVFPEPKGPDIAERTSFRQRLRTLFQVRNTDVGTVRTGPE